MRLWVIVGLLAAIVGGLIYFGVISKKDVEMTGRRAVADARQLGREITAPMDGVPPEAAEAARVCKENLRRLESAKRAVADAKGQAVGAVSWDEVMRHMGLRQPPRCPSGGSYSLNPIGTAATCSIAGNGTIAPGDDHEIMNF